jgi:hypothetical protein
MNIVLKAEDVLEKVKIAKGYVVLKQIMKAKAGKIILDNIKEEKDKFNFQSTIVMVAEGNERPWEVGDIPVLGTYATPTPLRMLTQTKTYMEILLLVHENDILAVDNFQTPEEQEADQSMNN